jgi:hypothetical protein
MPGAGATGGSPPRRISSVAEGSLASASQADVTGLTGLLPDPGDFRYYSVAGSVPHKGATDYELRVDGLVDRPLLGEIPPAPVARGEGLDAVTDESALFRHLLNR